MAYIDKDKALNLDFKINVSLFESRRKTAERAVQAYADAIAAIPAADVRPVVKARWVYTDMSRLVCSNCGNPVAFALKEDGWHHGDFCPNCVARMEES